MSDKVKKIIVIFLFIASVIGIAFALYWAFFRAEPIPEPTVEPTDEFEEGILPSAGFGVPGEDFIFDEEFYGLEQADAVAAGDITQTVELTTGPVYNATLSSNGQSISYYSKADGRFYSIDENGEVVKLSDKQFPNVETVTWNRNSQKAVLEFPDGSNIIYDFENEVQVTLPKHWEDFDFSPVRDEIIAKSIGLDPNNRWLVTANADGSNVRAFQGLGDNENKVQVNWSPNDQVVAFADTAQTSLGGALDRRIIFPVGKNKENYKGLIVEGLGFESKWAPSGKKLLYSVSGSYGNYRPVLWIVDATPSTMGDNRKSIGLNTWVEKCTWATSTTLYCAVPNVLPQNAGLQPDLFIGEPDSVYKIDIQTGTTTLIAIPESNKTMSELFISKDESKLYYTNALTGELELIKLK